MEERQMATCPYCAESIMPDAVKCKHCGEWVKPKSMARPGAIGGEADVPIGHMPTMRCRRCLKVIPVVSIVCPNCGRNPLSYPVVIQIIIGLLIPTLFYLFLKLF